MEDVLSAYEDYQTNNSLLEERIVHMTSNEILLLNPDLQELVTT